MKRVVKASRFVKSSLPFKYLGVSICYKKMYRARRKVLVEKMTERIRVWSNRRLSYTTRIFDKFTHVLILSIHPSEECSTGILKGL